MVAIARELGLNVWTMHDLPASVSGKIFRDPLNGGHSGFSIAVNARENFKRQRFTIGHEIGHFLLHRQRLERGALVDDTMYRSGLSNTEEAQANKVAADILMPYRLINSLVAQGYRDIPTLSELLQVSQPALKIRMGIPVS